MTPTSHHQTVVKLFSRVARRLRVAVDAFAADHGLTLARLRVLAHVTRTNGDSQAGIAAALDVEAPTLKRQIDALQEAGFVERRAVEGDERKRAIFPTDKARATPVLALMQQIPEALLRGVSQEDLAAFERTLERIEDNLARMTGK